MDYFTESVRLFEAWKEVEKEKKYLERKDENSWTMNLAQDKFIHFARRERIPEIAKTGKLLLNSPHTGERPGASGVFAVSLIYGLSVPSVQIPVQVGTTVKEPNENLAAIIFKTDTKPKYGYAEEVIWETDVNLIEAKAITIEEGIKLLSNTPDALTEDEEMDVIYYK